MRIGASLPVGDIGTGPSVIRDYGQAAEDLGFDYIITGDHVMGANPAKPNPEGVRVGTNEHAVHDPFVVLSFLAGCTTKLGFSTGIVIMPQRQTVLVAKQAAGLDRLCDGRFRLGVGVGWNEIEYEGLNQNFHNRGRRSEEQVEVMRALWAQPNVKFKGRYHDIDDSGINPRPASGHIPIWFGGHAEAILRRVARIGDGWMPLVYGPGAKALAKIEQLRTFTKEAGRDPSEVEVEAWISLGAGSPDEWRSAFTFWQNAGVTHVTAHTTYAAGRHRRIEGRTVADHVAAVHSFIEAVRDLR
ncbi:MAG: LLM class F420-dependent oxidoreductase [Alphaproteobacteria bacterium]|jgi:probable F420-dependent oxidoreductase|nr:LLM class F420-dependent oxidoreductase [Rhodospirillaceae bacterium]MDP6020829.1 LLM class F420-dependent oxidoreductase [Alphaproteobacteria bacterium]MDP6256858.1 LLM class F420-dependent oxidoreductase [Alphaproteobacteria bacterium]MDP7054564.1 LLM class F420-dependent oxidoreductase [Alphaproteobacteria bacterium]MDP7227077.1 LLM class F420-dependent oxidoreductase [Alphaproteobacteria bacterium]|tara:strand:+ start:3133 stop:4032 length:900 start_codon:yes stop_codon:yes gene_type:complete